MIARALPVPPFPMPSRVYAEGALALLREPFKLLRRRSGGVRLEFIHPDELTEAIIDALHVVASESMVVCRFYLAQKLRSFDRIILFRDTRRSALAGCTGLKIIDVEQAGRAARLIYTGAVFLAEAWRGKNLIHRAGVASMVRYGLTRRRLYLLSECDSFRAYLMGVRNCRDVCTLQRRRVLPQRLHRPITSPAVHQRRTAGALRRAVRGALHPLRLHPLRPRC